MKKNYIIIFAIAISVSAFGQVTLQETINHEEFISETLTFNKVLTPVISSKSSVTTIWEEDFSGGFPQDWSTHTSNTQGGAATCPWVWTLDGTWGYWNGNSGTSPSNVLNSTTASTGFLISDADSANHYAYGQPSGTTYHYIESSFTTSAIDLSLHPAVSLEFEHVFRYNNLGNPSFTPPIN